MAQVIVTIGEDGDSEITVKGGSGPSCHDLTKAFAKLGRQVEEKKLPEYFNRPNVQTVQRGS